MSEYSEREVFAPPVQRRRAPAPTAYRPPKLSTPVAMPMWLANTDGNNGSVRALPQNEYRASLTIQNLSTTATLYFSFDTDAGPFSGHGLGPGKGIIYDTVCPQSGLFLYMDATSRQLCIVSDMMYI